MKRKARLIAIPAFVASVAAHAQSSVTLYGVIDEGLNFTTNAGGHKAYQLVSGDSWGSRWGIKGNEDLGGGLAAIFQLENGFNLNNGTMGQGAREFGRQAWVGLASAQYGTLTLGRQYDTGLEMWGGYTAAGNTIGDFAAHPFDNDNADYDWHVNNAVKYVTPTWGGFKAEAMYGFSNAAGAFASNRMYGAGVTYGTGPLSAVFVYTRSNDGGTTSGGAISGDQVFTAATQQNIDAAVRWTFPDQSNIALSWSHTDVYDPIANAYVTDLGSQTWNAWKFDNFEINGQYMLRPNLWLAGSYTFTRSNLKAVEGDYHPTWQQVALMLNYDLSKRTSVYVQGGYLHVNGKTGTGFDRANIVFSGGTASGANQMVYRVAMLHRF